MIYRLYFTDQYTKVIDAATTVNENPEISFLFSINNADYQQFKININDESAQLEDADGVLMSPEAAKAYVATLP
jgi:hypothetical protein